MGTLVNTEPGDIGTTTPPVNEEPVVSEDTEAPVISLIGSATVELIVDDTYTDEGATAIDNTDGDITADIIMLSNIDTATVGSYTVTYNVTDQAGNQADEIIRNVNISESTQEVTAQEGQVEEVNGTTTVESASTTVSEVI